MRKTYPAELKAKVVMEAFKEQKAIEEIGSIYEVPTFQIRRWKKQAKENMAELFRVGKKPEEKEKEELIDRLYRELGKVRLEYDWLKKKLGVLEQ
jgi:transposase-like protein